MAHYHHIIVDFLQSVTDIDKRFTSKHILTSEDVLWGSHGLEPRNILREKCTILSDIWVYTERDPVQEGYWERKEMEPRAIHQYGDVIVAKLEEIHLSGQK